MLNKGTHILAGSSSGVLFIWNSQNGKLLSETKAHYESIDHIALSTDDSLIVTGCAGGSAKLWVLADLLEASSNRVDSTLDKIMISDAEPCTEYKGHNSEITGVWINQFSNRVYT